MKRGGIGTGCQDHGAAHLRFDPGGNIAPRVLQQRYQIIAGLTQLRELKVQQADTGKPGPDGQPKQVFGVIIPQDHHALAIGMGVDQARKGGDEIRRVDVITGDGKAVPMQGKTCRFSPIGGGKIGQVGGGSGGLQMHKNLGRGGIKRGFKAAVAGHFAGKQPITQIFQQQKAGGQILRKHGRRRQAKTAEIGRDSDEHRRIIGLARRRIHQDSRIAGHGQAIIPAVRGIPRQRAAGGTTPAGGVKKALRQRQAISHGHATGR